ASTWSTRFISTRPQLPCEAGFKGGRFNFTMWEGVVWRGCPSNSPFFHSPKKAMPDFILIEGDQAIFMPNFGAAVVMIKPGALTASGPGTLNGKKICVDGDEGKVAVAGCAYVTPQYSIPGTGTLKIAALDSSQKATKTKTGSKAVLLKGGNFTAKFEVQSPA